MNATQTTTPGPHGASPESQDFLPVHEAARRKQDLATSFRLCTAEGLVAMPIVLMTLPANVVLAALFTKALHLPNQTIGFICALPFVCNFLQVGISPLLARWFPSKAITVTGAWLHTLSWVAFCIMLGLLPADDPAGAGLWIGIAIFGLMPGAPPLDMSAAAKGLEVAGAAPSTAAAPAAAAAPEQVVASA